jgi:DNA replication and repair protein RecF
LANILDDVCQKVFPTVNHEGDTIKIRYALSFPVFSDKINDEILKQALLEQIKIKKEQEMMRSTTLIGPHLDDLNVYLNGKLARIFASQGQQRNLAVTLKLAEIYSFNQIKGFYPLFLLDEVLSELDENKKRLLLNHLSQAGFQSFLSSVSHDPKGGVNAQFFSLKNGCLI